MDERLLFYLSRLPQNLYVLAFLGAHVLAQLFEQLGQTGGAAGAREACGDKRGGSDEVVKTGNEKVRLVQGCRLTVFWQDFLKLVVVGAEATHALQVDHFLQ